jgi:transposase-like protein
MEKKIEKKLKDKLNRSEDTLNCPHCEFEHDPDDYDFNLRSYGQFKCFSCGELFNYEKQTKVVYTCW